MCPLYPFHIIILYLCLLLPLLLAVVQGAEELSGLIILNKRILPKAIDFDPAQVNKLQEQNYTEVKLTLSFDDKDPPDEKSNSYLQLNIWSDDPSIASVSRNQDNASSEHDIVLDLNKVPGYQNKGNWTWTFNISGNFLGFAKIHANAKLVNDANVESKEAKMPVSVVRKKTIQSKLFAYSVAILVSLAYINMGCAMDLKVVKQTLKKPIGPMIGFICQYIFMPLIAFALGFIFPASEAFGQKVSTHAPMQLGLFVTGCSPGGGASNIWTVMFGGNLDLSITMTAISTFAAFFMMPAWIFSLGQVIFNTDEDRPIIIPYYKICVYAFCLVIPLSIGLLISRYAPRLSKFLVRILKPMALFLILFIIIFGIWANLYIFRLMTWPVFLTGMGLPWIGFAFGCTLARLTNRPPADVIAIAIETGVQNTGMSIFILWFTLDQPLGDMTAVVPVAAAIMTPLPLLAGLCIKTLVERFGKQHSASSSETERGVCGIIKGTNTSVKNNNQLDTLEYDDNFKESESTQKLMLTPETPIDEEKTAC